MLSEAVLGFDYLLHGDSLFKLERLRRHIRFCSMLTCAGRSSMYGIDDSSPIPEGILNASPVFI